MIEFSTMLSTINRSKNKSLFTRIKTVDEKYPLYGSVEYEPKGAFDRMHTEPNTVLINESLNKSSRSIVYCYWSCKICARCKWICCLW